MVAWLVGVGELEGLGGSVALNCLDHCRYNNCAGVIAVSAKRWVSSLGQEDRSPVSVLCLPKQAGGLQKGILTYQFGLNLEEMNQSSRFIHKAG